MGLKVTELERVGCIYLAQDRKHWWSVENIVMDLWIALKARKMLISWVTVCFSRTTALWSPFFLVFKKFFSGVGTVHNKPHHIVVWLKSSRKGITLNLVVCILLHVLDQAQGFRLTRHRCNSLLFYSITTTCLGCTTIFKWKYVHWKLRLVCNGGRFLENGAYHHYTPVLLISIVHISTWRWLYNRDM
jgi:hypothetical protein